MKTSRASVFTVVASVALVGTCVSADVPQIRYASERPFGADGRRVESAWKKADTCIRFVEVRKYDVVLDQSEAQLLFDERNLYVSMTGFFDPKSDRGDRAKNLFDSNNFELLVKPEGGSEVHAVIDEFGRTYFAINKGETKDSGASFAVERAGAKGRWIANAAIPFSALGVPAPKGDLKARVGIFRRNINVHERQAFLGKPHVQISGYTPNNFNFSVSDAWAEMTLTRKDGEPRRVEGPAMGCRINLFANPEFDVPGRGWRVAGCANYQETQPMSGEWIYRAAGKEYQIMQGRPFGVKPGARYTLVVKARSFGSGSAIRVVEMVRNAAGKTYEGTWPSGHQVPVGPDMHEYYMPFTAAPDDLWSLAFFKVDSNSPDTGIEIAAIRLYEGEISSFEIRKRMRPGREETIPGTEMLPPPSAYGRMARPMRVLAMVRNKYLLREPLNVFAGTGAEVDTLLAEGKDQDVYSTFGDTDAITARIEKGEYDLYMVPRRCAQGIGAELAAKILANVKKGAGLYLEQNERLSHFASAGRGGAYGKGRVLLAKTAVKHVSDFNGYLPGLDVADYGRNFLPVRRFLHPQVVSDAVKTAFGAPSIPVGAKTRREEFVYGGTRHVATWTLDAEGRTLDWRHEEQPVAGTKLGAFEDDGETSAVAIEGDAAGLVMKWEFSDFSGRVLARGEASAAAKVSFRVPREKLYTNYGGLKLRLVRTAAKGLAALPSDTVVDQRGEFIFATGNDRARVFSDYTASMWPGSAVFDDIPALNRRLEDIGIRASMIPPEGANAFGLCMSCGFAVGGNWLCTRLRAKISKDNPNVLSDSFNAGKWRESVKKSVGAKAAALAKYGLFQHCLCDEPNLVYPYGSAFEVDAHPENLAEYRRRMEAKYGTIDEYNRRHRTSHRSFAGLGQTLQADARASGNFAEFIEWRNYNCDRWCEAVRFVSDAARERDPDTPFSMCETWGQTALQGDDYWKLLTRAGLGTSQEYTSMVYFNRNPIDNNDEVYRSFRPDMRVWGFTGYFYTTDRAKFMPWWCAAHRFGGFSWYHANNPGYNLTDPLTFAYTLNGRDLKASLEDSRLLDGLGKAFLAYDWAKRGIAIYYSQDSMLLATIRGPETKSREIAANSPLHDFMYSRMNAQYLVEDLLYQHDYVAPEQAVGGKLAEYKVLVMPRINAMSDVEVAAVKSFLARGGKVVADELPGGWDELGVPRTANPLEGLDGMYVYGRNFDDLDREQRVGALEFLSDADVRPVLKSATIADVFGREAMHFTDGTNDIYAVIRHPARSQDAAEETFEFGRRGFAWDVRARKSLGRVDRVTTKVPHAGACVFAVLPYEARGVELTAPSKAKTGEVLSLGMKLVADGAAAGTHVFHVELVPPSGECRFHFKRNLTAAGGAARLDFPLAFNDERGEWKVSVEDVLTGLRAERAVVVE